MCGREKVLTMGEVKRKRERETGRQALKIGATRPFRRTHGPFALCVSLGSCCTTIIPKQTDLAFPQSLLFFFFSVSVLLRLNLTEGNVRHFQGVIRFSSCSETM